MRIAVCADIHCNWEAFSAVSAHAAWGGADRHYFLGDLIGYGPDPSRCWKLLEAGVFDVTTLGNMEDAIKVGTGRFRPAVARAWQWSMQQLLESCGNRDELLSTMSEMRRAHREGDVCYLHGSPRDPVYEYLRFHNLSDAEEKAKLLENFQILRQRGARLCFNAHTHWPGILIEELHALSPSDLGKRDVKKGLVGTYRVDVGAAIINVGSVGQPRDRDWRAAFVLYDTDRHEVEFYRTEYGVEATIRKILAIADLPTDLKVKHAEMIARDKDKVRKIAASLTPEEQKSEDQLAWEWLQRFEEERRRKEDETR